MVGSVKVNISAKNTNYNVVVIPRIPYGVSGTGWNFARYAISYPTTTGFYIYIFADGGDIATSLQFVWIALGTQL